MTSADPDPGAEAAGEEQMSWADVYRPPDCGECGKAGCEQCTRRFLAFLAEHGTPPQGGGT